MLFDEDQGASQRVRRCFVPRSKAGEIREMRRAVVLSQHEKMALV
jgi:hypothetical protein